MASIPSKRNPSTAIQLKKMIGPAWLLLILAKFRIWANEIWLNWRPKASSITATEFSQLVPVSWSNTCAKVILHRLTSCSCKQAHNYRTINNLSNQTSNYLGCLVSLVLLFCLRKSMRCSLVSLLLSLVRGHVIVWKMEDRSNVTRKLGYKSIMGGKR